MVYGIMMILSLMTGPSLAQRLAFDFYQDGTFEEPCEVSLYESDTVVVDIWFVDWDNVKNIAAVDYYFRWNDDSIDVLSISYRHLTKPVGPWDDEYHVSRTGEYALGVVEFGAGVADQDVLLHTVVLHCKKAPGDDWIKATLGVDGTILDADGSTYKDVTDANCILHQLGCEGDEDCDDGLFCNGEEICVNGACQQGDEPCPGQSCNENTDSCEETPATTTIIQTSPDDSMTTIPKTALPPTPDRTESVTTVTITTPITLNTTTIAEPRTKTVELTERIPEPSFITTPPTSPTTTPFLSLSRLAISPSSLTLNSGGVVQFSIKTISDEKEGKGKYLWKIVPSSSIGSTIDENGLFTAGNNTSSSNIRETILATDPLHKHIYVTATVSINVKKQPPIGCELSINPTSATLSPGDTIRFFAKNFGERCVEGSYKWKTNSRIGSKISAEGQYTAGNNVSGNSAIDIIIVKDIINRKSTDAIVTVVSSEKGTHVVPDSTQKAQQQAFSGRGIYSIVLVVMVLTIFILIGIVLFWKIKR